MIHCLVCVYGSDEEVGLMASAGSADNMKAACDFVNNVWEGMNDPRRALVVSKEEWDARGENWLSSYGSWRR